MIANIKKIIVFMVVALSAVTAMPAATANAAGSCDSGSFFPSWYAGKLCKDGEVVSPGDPSLGGDTQSRLRVWATTLALNLVQILLYVVGYVSLGFIIFGGFKYITQGDNSGGQASARKTITNAVIGLVISILSVAIVNFVTGAIS